MFPLGDKLAQVTNSLRAVPSCFSCIPWWWRLPPASITLTSTSALSNSHRLQQSQLKTKPRTLDSWKEIGKRGLSGDVNNFGLTVVSRSTSTSLFVAVFKKKKSISNPYHGREKLEEWSLCTLSLK